jgi:NAD(P)-dependent dehydrogenase (short-subunit alcohol dehydrogenase family)
MTHANDPYGVRGRVTVITGGTGALGRAVTRRFLEAEAVVHVPVFDARKGDELERHLRGAEGLHLHPAVDLTEPSSVSAFFAAVEERAGRSPEILLNLAGGFMMAPIEETDPGAWDHMFHLNASTAFLCSRAVFPGMKGRRWGRIVNVSALPALERGREGLSAYAAAKAAVLNLTSTLSGEGVAHGITVNAVLPSILDTPANRSSLPDQPRDTWLDPTEVACVIAFLASPAARIVNGAAVTLTLG